jgi:hypothetical protein
MNLNADEFFRLPESEREEIKEGTERAIHEIRLQEDADLEEDQAHDHINEPRMRGVRQQQTGTTRVLTNDLRRFIRSKDDIYHILAVEG